MAGSTTMSGSSAGSKKRSTFTRLLIPAFLFQSVVIGGGYGTGAEIAQYFGQHGMVGGLLGQAVTMVIWAVLCAITYEFVRLFRAYDYGTMIKGLLGKFSFLYEICYYVFMLLILGVIFATASSMFTGLTGASGWWGVAILAVGITLLVFKGTVWIENVLSFWSYVLYAVYILFMVTVFIKFGPDISSEFSKAEIKGNWAFGGIQYAFYNMVVVAAILYTVRNMHSRKEAVTSGILSGIVGILPATMLLLVMGCNFSKAVNATVPVSVIFNELDMRWLYVLFEIVLFGTLIETGTGFIKSVDDRIEIAYKRSKNQLPNWVRPTISIALVVIGILVSTFGLTNLIAKGYGTICWGLFLTFVLPMVTIGVYKIHKQGPEPVPAEEDYNEN